MDKAVDLLGSLEEFLRYIAPGFVGIAAILLATPALREEAIVRDLGAQLAFVGAGVLLGITINAAHVALFEDLFCLPVATVFLFGVNEKLSGWPFKFMRTLELQRELRRGSVRQEVSLLQKRNDRLGATLTFLFCSSYPLLVVGHFIKGNHSADIFSAGIAFFVLAVLCDVRYVWKDRWAATEFWIQPQGNSASAESQKVQLTLSVQAASAG
jgi:hypothetical protein